MALNLAGAMNRTAPSIAMMMNDTPSVEMIDIAALWIDKRLQVRCELNEDHIETDLRPKLQNGERLDPIKVGRFNDNLYVVAGFHRVEANKREGNTRIEAEIVTVGTWRELLALALPTNEEHGLPLTKADRRRKVEMTIEEWRTEIEQGQLSDQQIARMCKVSPSIVNEVRRATVEAPTTKTVTRNGKSYEMNAGNIGRPKQAKPEELAQAVEEYLDAAYDDDINGAVQVLAAASALPSVAEALAEQADLPTYKPAALTEAIEKVVKQRAITIRLSPESAQALLDVLREHAPGLAELIGPQVEGTWGQQD